MPQPLTLLTPRLKLLALNPRQLAQVLEAPEQLQAALGVRLSRAVVTPVVERAIRAKLAALPRLPAAARPWRTYWLLIIQAENFGAGLIGFKGRPWEGEVEIGYGIDPEARGHGYTTEAVRALTDWAFTDPECRAVMACQVRVDNLASQRVLTRAGFRRVFENATLQNWRLEPLTCQVRPARLDDAAEVERLYRQSAAWMAALGDASPHVFDAAAYARGLEAARFHGLVVQGESGLLGYVLYTWSYDTDRARPYLYVLDLLVAEAARRRGLGRALLQAAAAVCRAGGGETLSWAVYAQNAAALAFYQRLGGRTLDELTFMTLSEQALR